MNERYNNTNWSVPFSNNQIYILNAIEETLQKSFAENPIKTLLKEISFPLPVSDYFKTKLFDSDIKNLKYTYNIEAELSDYHINPSIFYDEVFADALSFFEKGNGTLIISNDFLYNYIKKNFPNLKLVASNIKSEQELQKISDRIEYFENLMQSYDKIILPPSYVKTDFLKDFDKYSDVSKFELYAYYLNPKNKSNKIFLSDDEMKFLVEEVGIKNFKLYNVYINFTNILELLFDYIFSPEIYSLYEFTTVMDKHFFKNLKGEYV